LSNENAAANDVIIIDIILTLDKYYQKPKQFLETKFQKSLWSLFATPKNIIFSDKIDKEEKSVLVLYIKITAKDFRIKTDQCKKTVSNANQTYKKHVYFSDVTNDISPDLTYLSSKNKIFSCVSNMILNTSTTVEKTCILW